MKNEKQDLLFRINKLNRQIKKYKCRKIKQTTDQSNK